MVRRPSREYRVRRRRETANYRQLLIPTKESRIAVGIASIAIVARVVLAPLLFLGFLIKSAYLMDGTALIGKDDSFFDFVKEDPIMRGGCTGCGLGCLKTLLLLSNFGDVALMSKPPYQDMFITDSWNTSRLSPEALALASALDANSKTDCLAGINEWGSQLLAVVGTPQEVIDTVRLLNLSVGPQVLKEVTLAADPATSVCDTRWALESKTRAFKFLSTISGGNYSIIPTPDFTISPEDTECRPKVSNDGIIGAKLAFETHGEDLVANVPDAAKIFPYSFTSSLPAASRDYAIKNSINGIKRVSQPLFHAYYGACRVRVVNTTGVYIEDSCELVDHWLQYGLMLQVPDDVPVCTTGANKYCIHNNYNSRWEFLTIRDTTKVDRFHMVVNSFRQRRADSVPVSLLPGLVLLQMLVMGVVSLYQTMSHRRSVLLTQIWAYRCQNGHMQVVYLVQVTYHLTYNSDLYMIGLTTGTLTIESIGNLVFCFFGFSYCLINLVKARSSEQKLDRHFRLTWEIMQPVIAACSAVLLYQSYHTSLPFVQDWNGTMLRKTTEYGRKMCQLSDSCLVFKVNLVVFVLALTAGLGLVAGMIGFITRYLDSNHESMVTKFRARFWFLKGVVPADGPRPMPHSELSSVVPLPGSDRSDVSDKSMAWASGSSLAKQRPMRLAGPVTDGQLTSFERHCIGGQFMALFADCGDIAYVMYRGKRCTSIEAILLAGFVFHGAHIYQAQSVLVLLCARILPVRIVRTFNVLLLRWHVNGHSGRAESGRTCMWFRACTERRRAAEPVPLA